MSPPRFLALALIFVLLLAGATFGVQRQPSTRNPVATSGESAPMASPPAEAATPLPTASGPSPDGANQTVPPRGFDRSDSPAPQLTSLSLEPSTAVVIGSIVAGLDEPSGLAADTDGTFWTVSDRTPALFRISATGDVLETLALRTGGQGLEGISLGPTIDGATTAFTVEEEGNTVTLTDLSTGSPVLRSPLMEMDGYSQVRGLIESGGSNKGLEGVTWDAVEGRLYVLKEGRPGVLLELAPDLSAILSFRELTPALGFVDDDVSPDRLDFSGLTFDPLRNALWIVSDKGRRAYLFDLETHRVTSSMPLLTPGASGAIDKAEGVAMSNDGDTVTIISESARLMVHADVVLAGPGADSSG